MSDYAQGQGWWQASDGKWYPPSGEQPPAHTPTMGEDWVAVTLEVVGWLVVGGYALLGLAAALLEWTDFNGIAVGFIVFSAGAIQGLLLVAAGRVLGHVHSIAWTMSRFGQR